MAVSLWNCAPVAVPFTPSRTTNTYTNLIITTNWRAVFQSAVGVAGLPPNLQNPNGVVVVPDTTTPNSLWHLYVSDSVNNQVVHYSYDGTNATYLNYVNVPVMGAPQLMCTNASGTQLFVIENTVRVSIWGPIGSSAQPTNTFPYFYSLGNSSGVGQCSTTIGGIYVNPAGTLFVADRGNSRVQSYTNLPPGGINTIPNFYHLGTLYLGVTLNQPWAVHDSRDGNLYIVDSLNNRIIKTDYDFNMMGFVFNALTTPGVFNQMGDFAVNSAGHLLVADRNNHRVVRMDAAGNVLETIGGLGYAPGPGLYLPLGVAVDNLDRTYIVDQNNNRVCIYTNILTTVVTTNSSLILY